MVEKASIAHQHITHVTAERRSIMFDTVTRFELHGDEGCVETDLLKFGANGLTLGRVRSSGHDIDLTEPVNITFLMLRKGRLAIRILDTEYGGASGEAIALRPTARATRASADRSGHFEATTLQVDLARLTRLAETAGLSAEAAFGSDAITLRGDTSQFMTRHLHVFVDDLLRRPSTNLSSRVIAAISDLIDDQLCEILGMQTEANGTRRIIPAFHRVQQAIDLMHAQSDEPLSIVKVAEELGVGLRSLQLAFCDVYDGLSPRSVLNGIRLQKARERLLAANRDSKVTTAALDSGFFHLGRFSQAYARAFGELPSETLTRRYAPGPR